MAAAKLQHVNYQLDPGLAQVSQFLWFIWFHFILFRFKLIRTQCFSTGLDTMLFVGFLAILKCWDLGRQRSMGTSQQNQLKAPWHSCKIEIQLWECWRAGKLYLPLWGGQDFVPVFSCFTWKPFPKFQQRGPLHYLLEVDGRKEWEGSWVPS